MADLPLKTADGRDWKRAQAERLVKEALAAGMTIVRGRDRVSLQDRNSEPFQLTNTHRARWEVKHSWDASIATLEPEIRRILAERDAAKWGTTAETAEAVCELKTMR